MQNTPSDQSSDQPADRDVAARAAGADRDADHARARADDRSADPVQPTEGFEEGQRSGAPDTEVGRFDTGVADTAAGKSDEGRFDEGVADTDAPDKAREGRFDDGVDT